MAQIGERTFDVVMLDLALPDKNGMEVLSEIRTAASAASSDHDHGLRDGRERGSRHAIGRHQLHTETVGQREVAGRRACRRRAPEGGRRKHSTEARAQTALQL
jgi:hypothetical protein